MGIRAVREPGYLTVGDKAPVAVLPVERACARLLPVDERRLVAPVVDAAHDAQVRFGADEAAHLGAPLPGGSGPVGVVRVREHIRAEVALGALGLLHHGHGAREELLEERRIPEPEPGDDNDRHRYLPGRARPRGTRSGPDLLPTIDHAPPPA